MSDAPTESVEKDLPCIHCGYNLRGLLPEGNCPECGESIARSLRGNLLRFADPRWLRRVHLGLGLIFYTVVIGYILPNIAYYFFATAGLWQLFPPQLAGDGIATLVLIGALLVTTRESRTVRSHEPTHWRHTARIAAAIDFLVFVLSRAIEFKATSNSNLATFLSCTRTATLVFLFCALFGLFAVFAERIPCTRQARRARRILYAFPIAGLLLIAAEIIWHVAVLNATNPNVLYSLSRWLLASTTVVALVVDVWSMVVLWPIWRALRTALEEIAALRSGDDERQE